VFDTAPSWACLPGDAKMLVGRNVSCRLPAKFASKTDTSTLGIFALSASQGLKVKINTRSRQLCTVSVHAMQYLPVVRVARSDDCGTPAATIRVLLCLKMQIQTP
jgi:hypothetical protein